MYVFTCSPDKYLEDQGVKAINDGNRYLARGLGAGKLAGTIFCYRATFGAPEGLVDQGKLKDVATAMLCTHIYWFLNSAHRDYPKLPQCFGSKVDMVICVVFMILYIYCLYLS